MIIFFYLVSTIFSHQQLYASEMNPVPTVCGIYSVNGIVKAHKTDGIQLVVHEKTQSQRNISFLLSDQAKAAVYLDQPVTMEIALLKRFDGTKGTASAISGESKFRVPNPLNPKDTGFKLVLEKPCE